MQKHDKVSDKINLIKLASNVTTEFDLDQEVDWVRDILVELNENASEKTPEEYLKETTLVIHGEFTKKNKPDMGEFILFKGVIEATYVTECVRTLKPMKVDLDVNFKVCFIDETLSTSELFKDIDETWVDNDVYEIYFYTKRTIDFMEMIHEQTFLHYDQYPVLDADSKLPDAEASEPS